MKIRIKEKIDYFMTAFQVKSWVITIFVFLTVLFFGIKIWKDCVLNPQPSETALQNALETEQEYQKKILEIKRNNDKLKQQVNKFNNPVNNLSENKKYFKVLEIEKFIKPELIKDQEKFNPELVN